ncbi:MAG: hypothetical protein JST68_23420 [Bacteroidetes bacterium]|nr:hypothetical protein [Bacteroidota bacterium]
MAYVFKRLAQVSLSIILLTFISCGCRKTSANNGGNNNGSDTSANNNGGSGPTATPVGKPVGAAQSIVVGPAGGSFISEDNRLKLDFPAGAVSASTTITIQPVENQCPSGSGNAYQITPHDLKFNYPVKLTFSYGDSDVVNTIPMGLTIAYQGTDGVWRAPERMTKDTLHQKVSVLTNHFSGWSLFRAVELLPYTTVMEPGSSLDLNVVSYIDFSKDSLIPIPGYLERKRKLVKTWNLSGEGKLTPNENQATYIAPSSVPSRNPVAVSATLNTSGVEKFILVSNIYVGNQGLTFRIDNGPWMNGPSMGAHFNGYNYEFTAANSSTSQADGVTIKWMGGSHLNEFIRWDRIWPSFQYAEQPTISYTQLLLPSGKASPGGIFFYQASKTSATPYVIGNFYLQPAQKTVTSGGVPQFSTHKIEGFFKVKWQ